MPWGLCSSPSLLLHPISGAWFCSRALGASSVLAAALNEARVSTLRKLVVPLGGVPVVLGLAVVVRSLEWNVPMGRATFWVASALGAAAIVVQAWRGRTERLRLLSLGAALGAGASVSLRFAPAYAPLVWAAGVAGVAWLFVRQEGRPRAGVLVVLASLLAGVWGALVPVPEPVLAGVLGFVAVTAWVRARHQNGYALIVFAAFTAALWPGVGTAFEGEPGIPLAVTLALCSVGALAASLATLRGWPMWLSQSGALFALSGASAAAHALLGTPSPWVWVALFPVVPLLASRALPPWLTVTWAVGGTLASCVWHDGWTLPPLALGGASVLLTGLALMERSEVLRARLFSGGRTGRVAGMWAAFLLLCALEDPSHVSLLWGPAALILPVLWCAAARAPRFLVLTPLLVGAAVAFHTTPAFALVGVAVWVVLLTRLEAHVPRVRQWLWGLETTGDSAVLFGRSAVFGMGVVGGILALAEFLVHGADLSRSLPHDRALAGMAFGCLFAAALPVEARLVLGALMSLALPGSALGMAGGLLVLAAVAHHRPSASLKWTGPAQPSRVRFFAALLASVTAGVAQVLHPSDLGPYVLAGVWAIAAVLAGSCWGFAFAGCALAWGGRDGFAPEAPQLAFVALGMGALSLVTAQAAVEKRVSAWTRALGPGMDPMSAAWALGVVRSVATALVARLHFETRDALVLLGAATTLLVTRTKLRVQLGGLTLAAALLHVVPVTLWGAGFAAVGLGLTLVLGTLERGAAGTGPHRLLAQLFVLGGGLCVLALGQPTTPWALGATVFSVGVWRLRDARWEVVFWGTLVAALHAGLVHWGLTHPTGVPPASILPYFAFCTALGTLGLTRMAKSPSRARFVLGMGLFGMGELTAALLLLTDANHPLAGVELLALGVLAVALGVAALRARHEASAWGLVLVPVLGYLTLRRHGAGVSAFSTLDTFAGLGVGVLFAGLWALAGHSEATVAVFRRPFRVGAGVLPFFGLLALPSATAWGGVALLVGYAVHYSALGALGMQRRLASALAAVAFNAALVVAWLTADVPTPEYFLIPAGASMLGLLWMFRKDLSAELLGRARAVAMTVIYAASAWRPLLFSEAWAVWVCVTLCVLGVGVGVLLRIRSYVYLGAAFGVTSVVANLIRYGVRDHRLGAVFLTALGLLVLGFMVLLNAQRAAFTRRLESLRARWAGWEG